MPLPANGRATKHQGLNSRCKRWEKTRVVRHRVSKRERANQGCGARVPLDILTTGLHQLLLHQRLHGTHVYARLHRGHGTRVMEISLHGLDRFALVGVLFAATLPDQLRAVSKAQGHALDVDKARDLVGRGEGESQSSMRHAASGTAWCMHAVSALSRSIVPVSPLGPGRTHWHRRLHRAPRREHVQHAVC